MEELLGIVLEYLAEFVFAAIGIWLTAKVTPWIKSNIEYQWIERAVFAAEKIRESGVLIDKKTYAVTFLERVGIKVTPVVLDLIEAAVKELDILEGDFIEQLMVQDTPADVVVG